MKTKIFLPVLAMLSLMLFSFTTNTDAKDYASIAVSENGTYHINDVLFEDQDHERLMQLEQFALDNIPQEQLRVTISRTREWNDKKFTESKFIIWGVASPDLDQNQAVMEYRANLNDIMSRYMDRQ
jgi:hypothetical protein